MRQRLISISNQSSEEYQLRNMFRTFDTDNSGAISLDELRGMISKLGVTAPEECVVAVLRKLDANNNGVLEFEEF